MPTGIAGKPIIICLNCGQEKKNWAKGLCDLCYMHQHYQKNREERLAHDRLYYQKHREERAAYQRHYREEHPEKRSASKHRWQQENPEKCAALKARRKACKLAVPNTLTPEQLEFERRIGEATYPGEKLDLHHIIPFSKGGGHTWGNIVFIPASLNSSIKDRLPEQVYKQGVLLGTRF